MSRNVNISIIMSVFNGDKYLNTAIDAILNQTFTDFELIIINDGSTDNTNDILNSYTDPRIRVFNQKNRGLIQSLNRGISLATGKYIARQDADDISLPDRIKEQVNVMENNSEIVLVGSSYYLINDNDDIVDFVKTTKTDTEIRWKMLFKNAFCHTSILIRSETLRKENLLYSENDIHAEDFGLWSRLIQYGRCYNIDKPLVKYRVHPNQISNVFSETQGDSALLISKKNIEQTGIHVPNLDAIRRLICLEDKIPSQLGKEDIEICKYYIQLLRMFGKNKFYNKYQYKKIKNVRFYHICNSINFMNIREIYVSGLLYEIIKASKLYLFKNIIMRGIRKLTKLYSIRCVYS